MAESKLLTGARVLFKIDGKTVGYGRNVTVREEIEYQPIETLGNIRVQEHCPIAYRCSLSASMFRIFGETVKSLGYMPQGDPDPSSHLLNILTSGDLASG